MQTEKAIALGLKRYWALLAVIYVVAITLFVLNSAFHANYSSFSSSIEVVSPRDALTAIAEFSLTVFMVLVILLSVDLRARDARERMLEVLDSRPFSNVVLVIGRFTGMFLSVWLPLVILLFVLQVLGWLFPLVGLPIGGTIDPLAIFGFAIYMALPAIAFCCAFVMFSVILLRYRLLALLVVGALFFVLISMVESKPFVTALTLDLVGTSQLNESTEWVPSIADFSWWLQRVGVLALAFGFLFFTIVIHPRLDGSKRLMQGTVASIFALVGGALIAGGYYSKQSEINQVEQWKLAHEQRSEKVNIDVISVSGSLTLLPGRNLQTTLDITFTNTTEQPIEEALFTLNPGFEVTELTDSLGNNLRSSHSNGLLDIQFSSPLDSDEEATIKVTYNGKPDTLFGYLDSATDVTKRAKDSGSMELKKLGTAKGIFKSDYVALMPGIRWLPTPGADTGVGKKGEQIRDFYEFDLNVSVPNGWTVAGPGLRRSISNSDSEVVYKFAPKSVVPEVAMLAAPFSRFSTEIDGIEFEVLLHPEHSDIVNVMAHGKAEIKTWVENQLSLIKETGLSYPYGAFTLVEVPNSLRRYGGGWRMGTTLAPPSMMLLKESGLPTARFDVDADNNFVADLVGWAPTVNVENDPAKVARDRLIKYFTNDFSGGNLFAGFARSIYTHQVSAIGKEAVALNFAMDELATMVVSGERSYFSVENALAMDGILSQLLSSKAEAHKTLTDKVIERFTSKPVVWESILKNPLSDFDPWESPKTTVDALTLKSGELARLIYDTLGPKKSGELLAKLLSKYRGKDYTLEQVVASHEFDDVLEGGLLDNWFNGEDLAGFTSDQIELYQLEQSDNGVASYQFKMRLKNEEPVAGYARVVWMTEVDGRRSYSDPIRIDGQSALDFGIVLTQPPVSVYVEPYLSLNRDEYLVKGFNHSEIQKKDRAPFRGIKPMPLGTHGNERIVADDLDLAFSVSESEESGKLLGALKSVNNASSLMDQGLPIGKGIPRYWSRRSEETAWGKYRHTLAYTQAGDGNAKAVLSSRLPQAGRWKLEVHLPDLKLEPKPIMGKWQMKVVGGDSSHDVVFDANKGSLGWNLVGDYKLPAGEVKVEFSNKSDGAVIIADSVAWSLIDEGSQLVFREHKVL